MQVDLWVAADERVELAQRPTVLGAGDIQRLPIPDGQQRIEVGTGRSVRDRAQFVTELTGRKFHGGA
ncbi:hypothetical protein NONI108955_43490 [Nocardia ninae]